MRLIATFLILNFQLKHIFAFPPNPLESSLQTNRDLRGYECGNFFFTSYEVKEALSLARDFIDNEYQYPQRYLGPLYIESKFEDYFLYPIRNGPQIQPHFKYANTVFFVVLTRKSNEEVDVVAKTTTGDYIKCMRRDGPHQEPLYPVLENANGYLCGHEFLTDDIIRQSLALAQTKVEGNPKYPCRYMGLLYPENSGLLMWPILRNKVLYKKGEANVGPYFLLLNKERQFVDVVLRGYANNFLRCIRSRKPPTAPASDPFTKLFVPHPKSGYLCNKVFFEDNILEENAERVKNEAGNANSGKHLVEYSGPPFNERCLIWSLLQDGSLSRKGNRGPYRLILTTDYKVLSAAMFVKGKYKRCERDKIVTKKNHDTSGYHCNRQQFSHQQLVMAAEEACKRINTLSENIYPARYEGPGFKIDGPYFTYPVLRNCVFGKQCYKVGFYRVVVNTNCEVVGALTKLRTPRKRGYLVQKRLVKCHRLDDGPLPPGFFDANAQTVSEFKVRS